MTLDDQDAMQAALDQARQALDHGDVPVGAVVVHDGAIIATAHNRREIDRDPELLLIGQPTRGVDIGAIEFIHRRLVAMRDAGKAILLVSCELDEILGLADRILVMFDGRIVGELARAAGRIGGAVKSSRKAAAARRNGKRFGGRKAKL